LTASIRRTSIELSKPANSIVPATRITPFNGVTATCASSNVSDVRSRKGSGR